MAEPLLIIEHLRVDYPGVVAVNDLCLSVEAGDIYGLIGPNGAGKTTTLRAAAGLQECTFGTVKIDGLELSNAPREVKKRLGFMPDFYPVYDRLTVIEFLDHYARAYCVPNRAQRIEECLAMVRLTDKRDALCGELSRGMKQRLVLAKTLLPEPLVLLLDEPASGLDPLGRVELRKLLLQLQQIGKAILISSHILTELSGSCNKAAIMERGKLVMAGSIAELSRRLGRRSMSVKWRSGTDKARQILLNAQLKDLQFTAQGATFEFEGDPTALDALLKTLVVEGVAVTEWRAIGDDLEQIFLESGAKELM